MEFLELNDIYDDPEIVKNLNKKIVNAIYEFKKKNVKKPKGNWDQEDIFLITYGDQFYKEDERKLKTFKKFYDEFFSRWFDIVHFLPFYPYTSDDGFSVVDYTKIDPELGNWEDVEEMRKSSRLMFDFVCNHLSSKSDLFLGYLNNNPRYKNYFINLDSDVDLSKVTRPRTSPLLTPFKDIEGSYKYIWTTFSSDQVDLNIKNPEVLLYLINVLLYYLEQNAEFIRLDAVGFLWKELETSCIHLPQTHKIIQLFRKVVDHALPGTVLITETNVPHKDNISYFGNGYNEAQMVYQFPLPPLVLNTIKTESSYYLQQWGKSISTPTEKTTFFNFLASHDGIGLNPIRGIVPEKEIVALVSDLEENGALVSYKENQDGSRSPYEINVTYMDALNNKEDTNELRLKRFLVAHSILLTFPGIPAIYVQSILGSRNFYKGVVQTKQNRTINRQKYHVEELKKELLDEDSLRYKTYNQLGNLIDIRKKQKMFHPNAPHLIVDSSDELFIYKRIHEGQEIIVIHNISQKFASYKLENDRYEDLITQKKIMESEIELVIKPYEFLWLKKIN